MAAGELDWHLRCALADGTESLILEKLLELLELFHSSLQSHALWTRAKQLKIFAIPVFETLDPAVRCHLLQERRQKQDVIIHFVVVHLSQEAFDAGLDEIFDIQLVVGRSSGGK